MKLLKQYKFHKLVNDVEEELPGSSLGFIDLKNYFPQLSTKLLLY